MAGEEGDVTWASSQRVSAWTLTQLGSLLPSEHAFSSPAARAATDLLGVQGSGCKVQGAGFRVQGSGFRVQGSEFMVQGFIIIKIIYSEGLKGVKD